MPTSTPKTRQITRRDLACISWAAHQYAMRLDQIQRLAYRLTPEVDRGKLRADVDHLSLDRTYDLINKWSELGLIEKDTILHGDKLWIWATRKGIKMCELDYTTSNPPSSVRIPHLYAINQVHLSIEAKRPKDLWQSERQFRREAGPVMPGIRRHIPDALLTNAINGKVTAIEVECHAKTERELEDDLHELAITYRSVWYFCTKSTHRQISNLLDTLSADHCRPFVLYDLSEYHANEYHLF
jgi:hypothetical protein